MCQAMSARIDLVPFLLVGLAASVISLTLSVVVVPELQVACAREWQPRQDVAIVQAWMAIGQSQNRWEEDSKFRKQSWQK